VRTSRVLRSVGESASSPVVSFATARCGDAPRITSVAASLQEVRNSRRTPALGERRSGFRSWSRVMFAMVRTPPDILRLPAVERASVWKHTVEAIEAYIEGVEGAPTSTATPDAAVIRDLVETLDFRQPRGPEEALHFVVKHLWAHAVHAPHPRYFGLFNPAPSTMGVAADAITAAFNPQLAAWSHSPFANEVEAYLVRELGRKCGYVKVDGTFTSGGAEANQTALIAALTNAHPDVRDAGLRGLDRAPCLYVSEDGHHSMLKAAMVSGLGQSSVRLVSSNRVGMDVDTLERMISSDRAAGGSPFLIVGTVGTTAAGEIDAVGALADVAVREGMWLHIDAAWGGAAVFDSDLRVMLGPLERADSITLDAHKWLSVPMGAGVMLTRHVGVLDRTFSVDASYMPAAAGAGAADPYRRTLQWSRRFIGLKLFLSLAVAGWDGYATVIRHQVEVGEYLRAAARQSGWIIVNDTWLPLVCLRDADLDDEGHAQVVDALVRSGEAWVSMVRLRGVAAIRACITNYVTGRDHVDDLMAALDRARRQQLVAR